MKLRFNPFTGMLDWVTSLASEITNIPAGNISSTNVQDAINELDSDKEPNLPTTPSDPTNQYLNGNRQWSAVSVGSGGYAANLYLTAYASSTVPTYGAFSYVPEVAETEFADVVTQTESLIVTYLYDTQLDTTIIDSGVWRAVYFSRVSNAQGDTHLRWEVFVRHANGTETTLFSMNSANITNTSYNQVPTIFENSQPAFTVATTDKFGARIYGVTSASSPRTIYTKVGDGYGAYINLPIRLRHSQLRAWNEDANYQHVTTAQISTWDGKQDALGFTPENVANKSTNTSLGTSDTLYPTQNAVKTYTDSILGNANALVYKGTISCSTNPNYPAADAGHLYIISTAGKIGGVSGVDVEVGDMAICNTDSTVSGDQTTVGTYWNVIQKNIVGAVTGPGSSVDSHVAMFDGTTGKVIKDSGITLSGSNTGDETQSTIKTKLGAATASVDGYATSAQIAKLDGIESGADLTDEGNVTSVLTGVGSVVTPSADDLMSIIFAGVLKKITWGNMRSGFATYIASLAQTFTNKRVTPRVSFIASSATPSIDSDSCDIFKITGLAVNITSVTITGTPTDGQKLTVSIVGTANRSIVWGSQFANGNQKLPTMATTGHMNVEFVYDTDTLLWHCNNPVYYYNTLTYGDIFDSTVSGWSITSQDLTIHDNLAYLNIIAQRTGGTLTSTSGNITDSTVATVTSAFRPAIRVSANWGNGSNDGECVLNTSGTIVVRSAVADIANSNLGITLVYRV